MNFKSDMRTDLEGVEGSSVAEHLLSIRRDLGSSIE